MRSVAESPYLARQAHSNGIRWGGFRSDQPPLRAWETVPHIDANRSVEGRPLAKSSTRWKGWLPAAAQARIAPVRLARRVPVGGLFSDQLAADLGGASGDHLQRAIIDIAVEQVVRAWRAPASVSASVFHSSGFFGETEKVFRNRRLCNPKACSIEAPLVTECSAVW